MWPAIMASSPGESRRPTRRASATGCGSCAGGLQRLDGVNDRGQDATRSPSTTGGAKQKDRPKRAVARRGPHAARGEGDWRNRGIQRGAARCAAQGAGARARAAAARLRQGDLRGRRRDRRRRLRGRADPIACCRSALATSGGRVPPTGSRISGRSTGSCGRCSRSGRRHRSRRRADLQVRPVRQLG